MDWDEFSASGTSFAAPRQDPNRWDILALEGCIVDAVLHLGGAHPPVVISVLEFWKTLAADFQLLIRSRPEVSFSTFIRSFIWAIPAGHSQNDSGLACRATDPEHYEDFIATAFNGMLQCWGEGESLEDIFKLADFALKELPLARHGVDHYSLSSTSRQWLKDALNTFHSSNPALVDTNDDILEGALRKHQIVAVDRFTKRLSASITGRRLFTTTDEHVGIAPPYVKEGDIICVLFGGQTLYVLRPLADGDDYFFLGECYVYGMMDGEAMPTDENSKGKSRWFQLR